jgi:DNA-binding HxlR family transcriptional regulator
MSSPDPWPDMTQMCHAGDPELFRSVLDRVGDTWSLLVIGTLRAGPLRFTELARGIPGISRRMLTRTLRQLERDGLVSRAAFAEVPPRVEYAVTALGTSLSQRVLDLAVWVSESQGEIEAHRRAYDERADAATDARNPQPA